MTLPKSVKVRSTCNACQQAKIRCSHEKPSCRRCQKHNIDCVYSISRRLGRPAKKRDHDEKKRKPKREPMDDTHEIDFNADSWLQDYITDVPETSSSFLDSGSSSSSSSNNSHNPLDHPISPSMISAPASIIFDCADPSMPSSSYYDQSIFQASHETLNMSLLPMAMEMDTSTSPADTVPSISTPVSPQQPPPRSNPTTTPPLSVQSQPPPSQPSLRPFEYEFPLPDSTGIDLETSTYTSTPQTFAAPLPPPIPTCHCHCHEQTFREVIRLNMMLCATLRISSPSMTRSGLGLGLGSGSGSGPAGVGVGVGVDVGIEGLGTGTLDMILNIQCGLQNLTEVILQCTLCAENRATLLTVVVVNIDALVGVIDRVAAVLVEEKYTFIREAFLGKLGGLVAVIRRIRFCMQEILVGSASRAQFLMMMETDRRLQMVIMRMRMGR